MSGRDLSGSVRQAVVEALKADPDVAALVGARIYDYVSAAQAYPFLRCTTMAAMPWEATGGLHGSQVLVQVEKTVRWMYDVTAADFGGYYQAPAILTNYQVTAQRGQRATVQIAVTLNGKPVWAAAV